MKYFLSVFLFLLFCTSLVAQNVGLGTTTPTELLDVRGNINVAGSIKANGNSGTATQVLTSNGNGSMMWADLCGYKNFKGFTFTFLNTEQTWTVPSGVTKIVAEIWGAGGGGNANGGGGSGGYGRAQFDVLPGQTVAMLIGKGGNPGTGTGSAENGGQSYITPAAGSLSLRIAGGWGATSYPGNAFGFSGSIGTFNYYVLNGEYGRYNEESYHQSSSTTFMHIIKYGRGGHSPCMNNTGGEGGYSVIDEALGTSVAEYGGRQGIPAGGGGGGGRQYGANGAEGMIIIHY